MGQGWAMLWVQLGLDFRPKVGPHTVRNFLERSSNPILACVAQISLNSSHLP